MRRWFIVVLVICSFALFGCKNGDTNKTGGQSETSAEKSNLDKLKDKINEFINKGNEFYQDIIDEYEKISDSEKEQIKDLYEEFQEALEEFLEESKKRVDELKDKLNIYINNADEFYQKLIDEYNKLTDDEKEKIKDTYEKFLKAVDDFKYKQKVEYINNRIIKMLSLDDPLDYKEYIDEIQELMIDVKAADVKMYDAYLNGLAEYQKATRKLELSNMQFSIDVVDTIHVNDVVTLTINCSDEEVEFELLVNNSCVSFSKTNDDRVYEIFGDEIGVATITVSVKDISNSKNIDINVLEEVIKPTKIYYDGKKTFTIGDNFTIIYRVMPSGASQDVIITCDNDNIVIDGINCEAVKTGESELTIKCADFDLSYSFKVNIYEDDVNNDITLLQDVTREMTSPRYWINKVSNHNDVIMTVDEILALNEKSFATSGCKLVNILNQSDTITKSEVLQMINNYTVSSSYKINGGSQPSGYANSLYALCNKDNIPNVITIKYGLINTFCDVRSLPTNDIATTSGVYDRFQETGLEFGEGVLIYHESTDGKWYFVQSYNYNGWVEKENITIVSKEEMASYINPSEFILVTDDELVIDNVIYRMCTKFPYVKTVGSSFICSFVTKDGIGETLIPVSSDVCMGYLPYTTENVLKQAFKLLGNLYSWGDDNIHGHDCSSTMNAVYRLFGFIMPRNTSNQLKIPLHYEDLNSLSVSAKEKLLDNVLPGTLVFLSGHVTMYIGCDNEIYYLLHNFGSGGGCNISTVLIPRSGSNNYIESFIGLVEMK